MIKFYVRTTGDRILHESYNQIKYELLIDKDRKPVDSFIKQLEIIADEDAVLLEDDLILCDNFEEEITKAINENPNTIINFFCYPLKYFTTHKICGGFLYNQCTYYPKGLGRKVAAKMNELRKPYHQYDTLENLALNALNLTHIMYRPVLVQHIDYNSLIQKSSGNRRCPYYIDYLKQLNISIWDAYEYKAQLIELMNKHIAAIIEELNEKINNE